MEYSMKDDILCCTLKIRGGATEIVTERKLEKEH